MDIRWITRAGVEWIHVDEGDEAGPAALVAEIKPRQTDILHVLWTVFGPATTALSADAINSDLTIVRTELDQQQICPTTGFELIAPIRGVMMRRQEDLIAAGARRIGDLEGRVMDSDPVTAEAVLQDLFELRHDLQTIRINAAQAYELYDNLLETLTIDHSVMQIDPVRLALSNELNRFVRKITAFGTIAISWTVVAGIDGMNFANTPELSWTYGSLFHRQLWL